MSAQAVPPPPAAASDAVVFLRPDLVHYQAARLTMAVELLDEVLGLMWTDDEEVNLVFRDALVLFIQDASERLESEARAAMDGKSSSSWAWVKPA